MLAAAALSVSTPPPTLLQRRRSEIENNPGLLSLGCHYVLHSQELEIISSVDRMNTVQVHYHGLGHSLGQFLEDLIKFVHFVPQREVKKRICVYPDGMLCGM